MKSDKKRVLCPLCGRKTKTMVFADTELIHFPLFCPWCKRESIIDQKPEPKSQR